MSGTEGGLFEMLGLWFLLITFFITIAVAIKVLIGGSSGSKPEHQDITADKSEAGHPRGELGEEGFQRRKSELEK